jgi:cytoskeletal protein RodZ
MLVVIAAIGLVAALGLRNGDDGRVATDQSTTTPPESTRPSSDLAAAEPARTTTTVSATTSTASTSTTQESEPTTIVPPTPSSPPTTAPPAPERDVQPRAPCSPEGATAVSDEGVPLICTVQKCHGARDHPELAQLTLLHVDKDFELIAETTGQPVERLSLD